MHILYVSREYPPSLRGGGIASYIKEMASSLAQKGHQITIISASDDTRRYSDETKQGIRVIRLKGGDFLTPSIEGHSKFKKLRFLYRFHSYRKRISRAILSLKDVDIIEVADFGAEGLYLSQINIPVVIRLHTPSFFNRDTLSKSRYTLSQLHRYIPLKAEERIIERAEYISSCSLSLWDWINTTMNLSPKKVSVIKNPIQVVRSTTKKIESFKEKKEITIFYAGTIVPTKGVSELFEACKRLNEQGKKVKLLMAGKEGKFAEQLKAEIKNNLVSNWCVFLGKLTRDELYTYYSTCDICCFPSWWENMPMVCLEAMSCGAIVIGSTSGGMKEIISDGKNGFLVHPKNTNALIGCILTILELDSQQINTIKQEAITTLHEHFSTDIITQQMLKYYQEIIIDYKGRKYVTD